MAKKHVIIIGGGISGCCSAHDLSLRGFDVTVIERGNIACSTTGRCSCDLHSGARYSVKDKESAVEVIQENKIARKIMPPGVMVENDGVFILVNGDDPGYGDQFFDGCADCNIPAKEMSPKELLAREPNVNSNISRVGLVPDAIVEPYRYTLAFAATAKANGTRFLLFSEVKELLMAGNAVTGVRVLDRATNKVSDIHGDIILNATGPWVNKISALAGAHIPLALSPGIHVVIGIRLTHLAINRMRLPGSYDWVAPIRNHSVLGTSSWTIQDCDYIPPKEEHIQETIDECSKLVPSVKAYPIMAINAAARPLIATPGRSERDLSRTFECIDHADRNQVEGFVTLAGGKLCTARAMAEKASDLICQKLGINAVCQTQTYPLLPYRRF